MVSARLDLLPDFSIRIPVPGTVAGYLAKSVSGRSYVIFYQICRTANKVTRPEKALILGFMAGSRYTHFCQEFFMRSQLLNTNLVPVVIVVMS